MIKVIERYERQLYSLIFFLSGSDGCMTTDIVPVLFRSEGSPNRKSNITPIMLNINPVTVKMNCGLFNFPKMLF